MNVHGARNFNMVDWFKVGQLMQDCNVIAPDGRGNSVFSPNDECEECGLQLEGANTVTIVGLTPSELPQVMRQGRRVVDHVLADGGWCEALGCVTCRDCDVEE